MSCSGKVGPTKTGLTCEAPECNDSGREYSENNLEGTEAEVDIVMGKEFNRTLGMVLVDKVKFELNNLTRQYDGVLSLSGENPALDEFALTMKDKKLFLSPGEKLDEKYLDSRDTSFEEKLESDGGMEVRTINLGNDDVYTTKKAYLSLGSKSLILPTAELQEVAEKVKELEPECTLEEGKLACKTSNSLDKAKNTILGFSLGENKLEIPILALVESCKSKECQMLLKSHTEDRFLFGEVIFQSFGVHIDSSSKTITFHRLKNSFSNKYHSLSVGTSEPEGGLFRFIGQLILFLVKIAIVLGVISVVINLYHNKERVVGWIQGRMKLGKEDAQYSPAFTEDIENAGVLHGYDPKNASKEFWEENTVDGI